MSNIPSSASAAAETVNPEHETEAPGAARKYIDAVLEQSFRHLFGPTATPASTTSFPSPSSPRCLPAI
jgi:GTP pyrophosphokinase